MKTHTLKIWPELYDLVINGLKPFEVRRNDRDYQVGDVLQLREWSHENGYSGRESYWQVTYLLAQCPGLMPGFCVLGLHGPWGQRASAE